MIRQLIIRQNAAPCDLAGVRTVLPAASIPYTIG
jgi:hypothetical protein